mgnify:CR=1 FL=1
MIYQAGTGDTVVAISAMIGNDRYTKLLTMKGVDHLIDQLKELYDHFRCDDMHFVVDCGHTQTNKEISLAIQNWLEN